MRRLLPLIILLAVLAAACARVQVPIENTFPCRMEFEGTLNLRGVDIPVSGAALLSSASACVAQAYGPGGLALYSAEIKDGAVAVKDMWGRVVRTDATPLKEAVGLLAGVPPTARYLYRTSQGARTTVTYVWGNIELDQASLPRSMHVNAHRPLDVEFIPGDRGIRLMIRSGSDTLTLQIHILQGGRWAYAQGDL